MSVFLVLALVSQLVLWCVIAWSWPGLAPGGILAFLLLCAGLPTFVIKNQCLPLYSVVIIIINNDSKWGPLALPMFRQ